MDFLKDLFFMQQTFATLFSVTNKIQVHGDKELQQLTIRQYMAMVAIFHLPDDATTYNNIAKKMGTTKQSVKQIISAIEKKGFIEIIPSRKDKRAMNVSITDSGEKALLTVVEQGVYLLEELFHHFTTEELEVMWRLLQKLYCFDGNEHDGFEENGQVEINGDNTEWQSNILDEFKRRRLQPSRQENQLK